MVNDCYLEREARECMEKRPLANMTILTIHALDTKPLDTHHVVNITYLAGSVVPVCLPMREAFYGGSAFAEHPVYIHDSDPDTSASAAVGYCLEYYGVLEKSNYFSEFKLKPKIQEGIDIMKKSFGRDLDISLKTDFYAAAKATHVHNVVRKDNDSLMLSDIEKIYPAIYRKFDNIEMREMMSRYKKYVKKATQISQKIL